MTRNFSVLLVAVSLAFAACAPNPEPAAQAPEAGAMPKSLLPEPDAPAVAELGQRVEGQHFGVTLTLDPAEPKAGEATFTAKIDHHGEPAAGAKASVELEMPEMGHGAPGVELAESGGGAYQGQGKLPMAGVYEATVVIDAGGGHAEQAKFRFEAKE